MRSYLFCHSDLNGAENAFNFCGHHRNSDKIDVEEFSGQQTCFDFRSYSFKCKRIKTLLLLVPYMKRAAETRYRFKQGIFVLDTNKDAELFIPNNISPKI
jgi:hypothetical protein